MIRIYITIRHLPSVVLPICPLSPLDLGFVFASLILLNGLMRRISCFSGAYLSGPVLPLLTKFALCRTFRTPESLYRLMSCLLITVLATEQATLSRLVAHLSAGPRILMGKFNCYCLVCWIFLWQLFG